MLNFDVTTQNSNAVKLPVIYFTGITAELRRAPTVVKVTLQVNLTLNKKYVLWNMVSAPQPSSQING